MNGRISMLSALRHRNYRLYWFGHLMSVLGQNMEHVAQSWLVLLLTNSPLLLGVTGLTHSLPTIALTLFGGVIADRAERRQILVLTQGATAFLLIGLTILIATGTVRLWHVLLFTFLSGCLRAFDRPSRLALIPQLVPRDDMANAVAVGSTIWQLSRLLGPAAAGILIFLLGIGPTYLVCFLFSLLSVTLWSLINVASVPSVSRDMGFFQSMLDGLNFIRKNEIFHTLIAMTFFNSVFGMSYLILMPIFARDILQVGSQGYGFLQSTTGAGALGGTLLVAYLAGRGNKGSQAILGATIFGALLVGFAFSSWFPLSLVLVFLTGTASQFYMTTISTILQLKLPESLRGRVMGIYGLTWDLMPVGGALAGAIAEVAGAPAAVGLGGTLVAAMALWVALYLPRVRNLDE